MLLTFLVSFIGFHIFFRINSTFLHSIGTSKKKLSVRAVFFSTVLCFLFQFFEVLAIEVWILVSFLILFSPFLSRGLRIYREKQLPMKCLNSLDQIILILKSGNSFRSAVEQVESTENSWFRPFLAEIRSSFQHQTQSQSESKWYRRWSREILEIEASKVKTLEQLEALRRQMRVEIRSQKRVSQVTSGPRFQIFFMSALFLTLNAILLRSGINQDFVPFLSISWILFLFGVLLALFIMRSIKWKI